VKIYHLDSKKNKEIFRDLTNIRFRRFQWVRIGKGFGDSCGSEAVKILHAGFSAAGIARGVAFIIKTSGFERLPKPPGDTLLIIELHLW